MNECADGSWSNCRDDLPRMADIKPITTKLKEFVPAPYERELWKHDEQCATMKSLPCDCMAPASIWHIPQNVEPPIAEQGRIREKLLELAIEKAAYQQRLEMCEMWIAHYKSLLREL